MTVTAAVLTCYHGQMRVICRMETSQRGWKKKGVYLKQPPCRVVNGMECSLAQTAVRTVDSVFEELFQTKKSKVPNPAFLKADLVLDY